MRYATGVAILLLGGCALSTRPANLPEPEQEAIVVAALQSLRATLSGDLLVDPRVASYDFRPGVGWAGGYWPRAQAESFAAVIGGGIAELDSVRWCQFPWLGGTPHQMGCVIEGADAHLSLSRPVGRGDEAAVMVYLNADSRTAVRDEFTRVVQIHLSRGLEEWTVTGARVVAAR